jgi:hypothetical protein
MLIEFNNLNTKIFDKFENTVNNKKESEKKENKESLNFNFLIM